MKVTLAGHSSGWIAGFAVIACLFSCDDNDEPCSRCGEVKSTFDREYFIVFIENPDTFLIQHDSIENISYDFPLCNSELLRSLESQNIIETSGSLKEDCVEPNVIRIDLNEMAHLLFTADSSIGWTI